MRKLNKKGLKQQGGQTQEQMMQQAQQQQQSLSTLIANAMSNQGYDLTEVIDELRFNDVDDGMIMEALMDMGYTQEEVQKLFQEKQNPQKFVSDLSAFISEDQQKAKLGLELPQFQGDEKSENNELPKIGETNSEYIMRTTGRPGFYNNTDIWNGEKFVPNPNTNKTSNVDLESDVDKVVALQRFFQDFYDESAPLKDVDSVSSALSTMFGGVKKMGRSLGVGKKNKAYNKMMDKFYADPKSYIKDNSYVAFNPQQKEFQMIYGDSSLFTPQQKEMFINQGRKLDDQVTGLDLAEMSGQPINIPFIGDINFSESQRRKQVGGQPAGSFDDPESILTEEELLEKYGLMPQVTTPQDGMVGDPSQLQTNQQIKPVDSPTGIYPGDLFFDYMGGIQNYDNPIDMFLDPTSQISKRTPFGPDSFDYEKAERLARVAGTEGLDPSMMIPSNDPLSNQNVELPTPEELGFFDSSPARKTESNVQDENDEIPPEMEIDEVEPEIDEDPEITFNKKPSLKRFADFSEGAVDFASGLNTLSRIGQDAMRKSEGYANTMADTFTPQEGNRGVYSVNDGLLQPTEKASNYPTFVGRKGFELSESYQNEDDIINKLLKMANIINKTRKSSLLKENMKRGGMIVDLDSNMIAKLIAAGAKIEML